MRYGCIGEHLQHSFSREIHTRLGLADYALCELRPDEVAAFMVRHDFAGINVTIPYKQTVMPFLDEISEIARAIGAVNTVVNQNGRLFGDNTDFAGMDALLRHAGVDPAGKKALILGSGGTSHTAQAVLWARGAVRVETVSRSGRDGSLTYEQTYRDRCDTEILVNTTPVGMFPHGDMSPIELDRFPALCGVIDAVYNPLRTVLVQQARRRGIPAEGGLYMLVMQGVRAYTQFTGRTVSDEEAGRVFDSVRAARRNVVLIGMPGSGKSTVGRLLSARWNRPLIDTDERVEEAAGCCVSDLFAAEGETGFRVRETAAVFEAAAQTGVVIATGGGAILRPENVAALEQNGRIYFLDRPLSALRPTADRPLALTEEALARRMAEREPLYRRAAQVTVPVTGTPEEAAAFIERDWNHENLGD